MANLGAAVNYFNFRFGETIGKNIGTNFLKPVIATPASGPRGIIDLFEHRLFANTPSSNFINKLPFGIIQEYSLLTNSLVNQASYFSSFTQVANIPGPVAVPNNRGDSSYFESFFSDLVSGYQGLATAGLQAAGGVASAVLSRVGNTNSSPSAFKPDKVGAAFKPYNGLYQTAPTGFTYVFPYFDDVKYNISNNFKDNFSGFLGTGDTSSFKYIPNVFKIGGDLLKNIAENFLSVTPGAYNQPSTYIEVPQYFAAGDYESYTFKFNLLNTYEPGDVQKNFDILFLLAFQNLPFREDIVKVQPPKLYTIFIPGQTFVPYAFIKSFKVNYLGNRRIVSLKKYALQGDTSPPVASDQRCIVPDCYQVEITFSSLIKPSSNQLLTPDISVTNGSAQITTAQLAESVGGSPVGPTFPGIIGDKPQPTSSGVISNFNNTGTDFNTMVAQGPMTDLQRDQRARQDPGYAQILVNLYRQGIIKPGQIAYVDQLISAAQASVDKLVQPPPTTPGDGIVRGLLQGTGIQ